MTLTASGPPGQGMAACLSHRPAVLTTLGVFILVYSMVTYGGLLDSVALIWWSDMAWTVISLAAGLKCLHTAARQRQRNQRRAWIAFGLAALLWFTGMIVWDYLELVRAVVTPYPSLADYFYLALAPAFVVGIFFYREGTPSRYVTLVQVGNMGIIVCTVIIVTSIILYPQIQASDQPPAYLYFAGAYAVVFMSAFLFALFSYWFYRWNRNREVFLILLAALFLHASADALYTFELMGKSYGAANYLNVVWIVAFALQYWAAAEQDALDQRRGDEHADNGAALQQLEGIAPSLSMIAIVGTLWAFGEQVSHGFLMFLLAIAMVLMLFLVVQEWSLGQALTSARSNLEEKVRQRTQQLTLANRELEAYSYSIAHDLRAPLRAVTGFSQVLLEDAADRLTDEQQDSLNRIAGAGKYMAQLIDEILDLARVSRVDMTLAPVDLSAISRKILRRLCEAESDREVEWSVQEGLAAQGDERLLSLAMQNLLGNAIKYTAGKTPARITVGARTADGETIYYVRDNGAGFDMQYADKLFRPFHRLHGQQEFPGSGVGLASVLRIVERHGGRVWGEAAPGQGATFYFTLPGGEELSH
jgi:signal transduction histidine kinase